jgi:hypothetical protein
VSKFVRCDEGFMHIPNKTIANAVRICLEFDANGYECGGSERLGF